MKFEYAQGARRLHSPDGALLLCIFVELSRVADNSRAFASVCANREQLGSSSSKSIAWTLLVV